MRLWRVSGAMSECPRACIELAKRTDVPALCDEYAQGEGDEKRSCAAPSVGCVWCGLVEIGLEHLLRVSNAVPSSFERDLNSPNRRGSERARLSVYNLPFHTLSFAPSQPRKGYQALGSPWLRLCSFPCALDA
jgi:hypothetical protein